MVKESRSKDIKIGLEDLKLNKLEKEVIYILKSGEKNSIKKAENIIKKFVDDHV